TMAAAPQAPAFDTIPGPVIPEPHPPIPEPVQAPPVIDNLEDLEKMAAAQPEPPQAPAFETIQEPEPIMQQAPPVIENIEDLEKMAKAEVTEPVIEPVTETPPAPPAQETPSDTDAVSREILDRAEDKLVIAVKEILWEIVPPLAERIIKEEIEQIKNEVSNAFK
ncbi:MAG: hypothetical protein GY765_37425, partial [bacterium]|nr:hypothetical protein [bacterium]